MRNRLSVHAAGRSERGAAAVEAALLISSVLAPLMLGVLNYGHYFWQLQRVPELDPNIDQSSLVGTYCVNQLPDLLNQVRAAALLAANDLDDGSDPLALSDITATVASYTLDAMGVVFNLSVSTNAQDELIPYLPLPDDGNVVSQSKIRVQNVKISGSC